MSWPRTMNAVPIKTPDPKSKTAARARATDSWRRRVTPNGGIVLRPNLKRDDREHRSCRVRVDRPAPGAARHAGRLLYFRP